MLDAEARTLDGEARVRAPVRVSVLLIDPVRAYSDAIALALRASPGIGPVRAAARMDEALRYIGERAPDVVVINVGAEHGRSMLTEVRARTPARVVATGAPHDPAALVALMEAGVAGYLCQDEPFARLVELLRAVARDESLVSPCVAGAIVRRLAQLTADHDQPRGPDLTEREVQILRLVARGMSNQEIADGLGICLRTVKNHVHNVLTKLGARRRGEAAATLWRLEQAGLLAD